MTKPARSGWAVSIRDKTLHYFVDYRALCGGMTFYAWPSADGIYEHCHECTNLLEAFDDSGDDQRLAQTVRARLGGPTVPVSIDDLLGESCAEAEPVSSPVREGFSDD